MIVGRYVVAVLIVVDREQMSVVDVRIVCRMVSERFAEGRYLRSATMMKFEVASLTAKTREEQILANIAEGNFKERFPYLGEGGE